MLECRILFIVIQNVLMLSAVMGSVIMLSTVMPECRILFIIMLNVIMVSAIMLSTVLLSVAFYFLLCRMPLC
jgi:hypothetical protein